MSRKVFDTQGTVKYSKEDVLQSLKNFYGVPLDEEQKVLRDTIWSNDIDLVLVNAKAGTGKTTVAVGTAVLLVEFGLYDGIVYIMSPSQEMTQGYLPGSIEEKSAPYMEPLFEALIKIGKSPNHLVRSSDNMQALKNGTAYIQAMTHTFLRGCNLENKVIIIDEASNFYFDSLKKTITRCHDTDKVIIIGHTEQCDLIKNPERSGFPIYIKKLEEDISSNKVTRAKICKLTTNHRGWISTWADNVEM